MIRFVCLFVYLPFGNSLEPYTGINSKLADPVSCTNAQINVFDLGTADRQADRIPLPQPLVKFIEINIFTIAI